LLRDFFNTGLKPSLFKVKPRNIKKSCIGMLGFDKGFKSERHGVSFLWLIFWNNSSPMIIIPLPSRGLIEILVCAHGPARSLR
jgi:hypothetical protein